MMNEKNEIELMIMYAERGKKSVSTGGKILRNWMGLAICTGTLGQLRQRSRRRMHCLLACTSVIICKQSLECQLPIARRQYVPSTVATSQKRKVLVSSNQTMCSD